MITNRLWYALLNPPARHPIFRRITRAQPKRAGGALQAMLLRAILPSILVILILGLLSSMLRDISIIVQLILLVPLVIMVIITLLPFALFVFVTLFGAYLAFHTSGTIAGEKQGGRYALLCVLPEGEPGINWLMSSACLHRERMFSWLRGILNLVLRLMLIALGFLVVASVIVLIGHHRDARNTISILLEFIALVAIFMANYSQTLLFSILVSMIVPTYTRSREEARLAGLGGFLLLQLTSYVVIGLLLFWVMLPLYNRFPLDSIIRLLVIPFGNFMTFYLVRDALIQIVWRLALLRFDSEPHSFDRLLRRMA